MNRTSYLYLVPQCVEYYYAYKDLFTAPIILQFPHNRFTLHWLPRQFVATVHAIGLN